MIQGTVCFVPVQGTHCLSYLAHPRKAQVGLASRFRGIGLWSQGQACTHLMHHTNMEKKLFVCAGSELVDELDLCVKGRLFLPLGNTTVLQDQGQDLPG